jgi:hypothetical protein
MTISRHLGLLLAALALSAAHMTAQGSQASAAGPTRIDVASDVRADAPALAPLVRDLRAHADAFVFLSGGASKMSAEDERKLLAMFDALADVARTRRIAVGDGGTQAGIMRAAGEARRRSGNAFALIGVTPAGEVLPAGQIPIDPNHSHLVAVRDPKAKPGEGFGTETETMYRLFAALAEGRPSVTIVANGGGITLREVEANVRAGRRMIVIEGSGRGADAIVSLLRHRDAPSPEAAELRPRVESMGLVAKPDLFTIVPLSAGAAGLRDALLVALK